MPRNAKIVIRNGTTTPSASDFDVAEPAWDRTAGKLYIKDGAGSMVEIGAGGGGGGGVAVNYQEFTSSGTWTKPAGATSIYVECISGGAGGGSGRRGAAGTVRCGGGSGGTGRFTSRWLPASLAGSTATVTVGAGGVGGAAVTTDDTSGNNGTGGGSSSFGSLLLTPATNPGSGGTASSGTGGVIAANGSPLNGLFACAGQSASTTGGITQAATKCSFGPGQGAAGAGIPSGNAQFDGAPGGEGFGELKNSVSAVGGSSSQGNGGAAGLAAGPVNGGNGLTEGDGGGGGASSLTGNAGSGGNGAFPGGSGAGGGASVNGFNSGAGGNGAAGVVRIWSW